MVRKRKNHMRDQRELALQCLEVEDAGGSVIEFLKGLGFISASATWQRRRAA